jgi:hypothetical protein
MKTYKRHDYPTKLNCLIKIFNLEHYRLLGDDGEGPTY